MVLNRLVLKRDLRLALGLALLAGSCVSALSLGLGILLVSCKLDLTIAWLNVAAALASHF